MHQAPLDAPDERLAHGSARFISKPTPNRICIVPNMLKPHAR